MFLKLANIWFKNSKFWQGNYHPIVSRPETLYCLNRNQERISMFQYKSTSHSKLYLNPFHRYFENAEKWLSFFSQGHTVTLTSIFLFTQLKFYLETTFHHYIASLLDMLQSLLTVSTYNVTCFYPLTYVTAEKDLFSTVSHGIIFINFLSKHHCIVCCNLFTIDLLYDLQIYECYET